MSRLVARTGGCGVRVRRLGGDRAGEIRLTRFLRNSSVTSEEMVETARTRLPERCRDRHVLAIQDTTVTRSTGGGGTYLHAMIGVDADDGALLGLIDGQFLERTSGGKAGYKTKPITDKQSYRWLEGMQQAAQACATASRVTMIADRESDIFEVFACRPATVDLIVRVTHNRRTIEEGVKLFEGGAVPAGTMSLDIPASPGRKARTTSAAVSYYPVTLKRPTTKGKDVPETAALYYIDLRETGAPKGVKPVHWRLVTSHAVTEMAEALEIIQLYRRRWVIEEVFRTMKKKGFDIEGILVEDEAPRQKLIMATLVAAITIQQLVHVRDGAPKGLQLRPALDAFDVDDLPLLKAFTAELEGKTDRQKNPHPPTSLSYGAWVCARLGGWTGYYGKPGPIVMLNGWIVFQNAKRGAALARQARNV